MIKRNFVDGSEEMIMALYKSLWIWLDRIWNVGTHT